MKIARRSLSPLVIRASARRQYSRCGQSHRHAGDTAGTPFTEETAHTHADGINAAMASADARDPSPFNPVVRAVVLHHGVPVAEEVTQ